MDSKDVKKEIMRFIRPSFIPAIIFTLWIGLNWLGPVIFFFITLPAYLRGRKKIKELEASGKLEKVIEEWSSPNAKRLVLAKGKIILTDHYVFCKRKGDIFTYDEIIWAYRTMQAYKLFFTSERFIHYVVLIPKDLKRRTIVLRSKQDEKELDTILLEIINHNKNCMAGYTEENLALYRQLVTNKEKPI